VRVLLAGYGTRGDVQPLVALGRHLREAGHEVAIGASPVFATWVAAHGLDFHAIGGDIQVFLRRHAGLLTRRRPLAMRRLLEEARAEMDLAFEQTGTAAEGADLVVSGVHTAAASVAEALGVPHRTLLFCPQLIPSAQHPPMGVPWLTLPRPCNRALWWAGERAFGAVLRDALDRHRRALGLAPIGSIVGHLLTDRPIVASDPELGGLPEDAPPSIRQTGSLALAADGPLEPALERFLAAGEPPVGIGFGSMPDDDPERTTSMLVQALAATGRRGVLLSGWAGLGGRALPASVFATRSAPHAPLFARLALAVHHGGAGTTAAAARAGVPQLVVPHAADQYYWGHQVHRRGLGSRPIPRPALTAARLARAIAAVRSSDGVVANARATADALARRDGVAALAGLLEGVVAEPRAARAAA